MPPIVPADREILEGGRHGRLVPVGDPSAMAGAITDALDGRVPPPRPGAWAPYTDDAATDRYLNVLQSVITASERSTTRT